MEGGKCSVCCSLRASKNLVLHPCLGEFPDYALSIPSMHSLVSTAMDTGFIRHKSQATHFAMTVNYCLSAIFSCISALRTYCHHQDAARKDCLA